MCDLRRHTNHPPQSTVRTRRSNRNEVTVFTPPDLSEIQPPLTPWPTGWARRCSCSRRWPRRSAAISSPSPFSMLMTPPSPVLAPGLGRTRTGRLWVVVRDERPWGSGVPPRSIAARRTARLCMPRRCPVPAEASCTQMATPGSANSTSLRGLATTRRCSRWPAVRRKFCDVHHAVASATALEAMQRIAALYRH